MAIFGRALSLLMNRATMYQADHPYFRDALEAFFSVADELVQSMSPLVFIMNQERFFIDEEPLDPRINVSRLVTHFKKAGVQSVSFYKGLRKNELRSFMEAFTALHLYPNAEAINKAIVRKGIRNVKINHVFYQKVTSEDEVVSRDALKKLTPEMSTDAERKSKKMFLDALLENVLTEELEKTLSVQSLLKSPAGVSRAMIENDLAAAGHGHGNGSMVQAGEGAGSGPDQGTGPGSGAAAGAGPGTGAGRGPGMKTEPGAMPGAGPGTGTATGAGTGAGQGPGMKAEPGATPGATPGAGPGTGAEPGAAPGAGPGAGFEPGVGTGAGQGAGAVGLGQAVLTEVDATGNAARDTQISAGRAGTALAHQLDLISDEIEKSMRGEGDVEIQDLAMAVFQMKAELIQGIESQKALGIAYENEEAILEKANDLTDRVFLQIVKDEYRSGKTSTVRMAQILRRLIPDPDELKRLLPKIKTALMSEGMALGEYLKLIKELGRELQDEGLARILQDSAEQVGVDGEELIEEIKQNPKQAAELMALAAEIRKGDGDEQVLTDVLVEYVERLGFSMAREGGADDEDHLRSVMTGIESKLVKQFRQMDIQDDVIARIEDKLDQRLDTIVQDIKMDFIRSTGLGSTQKEIEELTVLQTLERSVSASDELGGILKAVRQSVEAGNVDEDDFSQIYAEIERQKKLIEEKEANREMPYGVLSMKNLTLFLEKEISKAVRYELPFSALGFSVVKARYLERQPGKKIPADDLLDRVLARLAQIVRDTDVVGKLRKNQMVALLPLTPLGEAKLALKRTMKLLHGEPFEMEGIPLEIKVAGSITPFQKGRTPNTETFIDALSKDLVEMATRVKNIHALL